MATAKKTTRKSVPVEEMTDEQKVAKSYSVAIQQLKDKHLAEFNDLRVAAAKELGVEWKPQPTAEEKATEQIRALIEANPGLAERYPSLVGFDAEPEVEEPQPQEDGPSTEDA